MTDNDNLFFNNNKKLEFFKTDLPPPSHSDCFSNSFQFINNWRSLMYLVHRDLEVLMNLEL